MNYYFLKNFRLSIHLNMFDMYWVQSTPSTHTPPEGIIKTMPTKYPQEFKERAVRLVGDRLNHADAPSITAAIKDIAPRLGISHNTLARWCNTAALDTGKEISTTSDAAAEIRRLKRENAELRRANEILKTASA